MALISVRSFSGVSPGIDHHVQVYIDNTTFAFSVTAHDNLAGGVEVMPESSYSTTTPYVGYYDYIDSYCGSGATYEGYAANVYGSLDNVYPFARMEAFFNPEFCPSETPPTCDLVITSVDKSDETIAGHNNGTITIYATSSNPPHEYSKNGGSTWQSSATFTGLAPGTYSGLMVKNSLTGCTAAAGAITIAAGSPPPPCDLTITSVSKVDATGGANNGSITVNATTSSAGISYSKNGGLTNQSSNTFTGLAPGNYVIFLSAADGCTKSTSTITILDSSASCTLDVTASKTNESSIGLNDGTITASATGATGSPMFSKDNVNWQPSGFFSGLSPATYTIYCKDSSTCTDTVSVTISAGSSPPPTCDLTITSATKTDTTTLGGTDGTITVTATSSAFGVEYSRNNWLTAETSGYYTGFTSGSFTIKVRDAAGCTAQVTLNIGSPAASCNLAITSSYKINETGAGLNDGVIDVVASSTYGGVQYSRDGGSTWQSSGHYTGFAPGTYNILVKDSMLCTTSKSFTIAAWSAVPQPEQVDPDVILPNGIHSRWSAAYNPIVFGFVRPDDHAEKKSYRIELEMISGSDVAFGAWYPDLNGFVRCDVGGFVSSLVSWSNRSAKFNIRFRQAWAGFTDVWTDNINDFYVTFSAKQLGDVHGGNMALYLNHVAPTQVLAKWLTRFTEPVYNVGLPFGISYINSETLTDKTIEIVVTSMDINKGTISVVNKGVYSNVSEIKEFQYSEIPDVDVEYLKFQIWSQTDSKFISEPILIKVKRPCDNDPYIFLKWVNLLGGYDYYRFGYMQARSLSVTNHTVVSRTVFNWETDNTIFDVVKKSAIRRRQFGANDLKDLAGIESLPMSTKVLFLNSSNKYMTVELISGTFEQGTSRDRQFSVNFAINLPEVNIQRQ